MSEIRFVISRLLATCLSVSPGDISCRCMAKGEKQVVYVGAADVNADDVFHAHAPAVLAAHCHGTARKINPPETGLKFVCFGPKRTKGDGNNRITFMYPERSRCVTTAMICSIGASGIGG